jgi:hypothetical protein
MTSVERHRESRLRHRIQACTWCLIIGLVLSGLTAIPLQAELDLLARWMGADAKAAEASSGLAQWIVTVRDGLRDTYAKYPFMGYGTDWLAFAHLVIAVAFVGALRHPVRNAWLFTFGMIASVAVIPWAFIFGEVRDIPVGWRLIDSAFGVIAFIPCWLAHKWTRELEQMRMASSRFD